jgi:hypothetical protein
MSRKQNFQLPIIFVVIIAVLVCALGSVSYIAYRENHKPKTVTIQDTAIDNQNTAQSDNFRALVDGYNAGVKDYNALLATWNKEIPTLEEHYSALGRSFSPPSFAAKSCFGLTTQKTTAGTEVLAAQDQVDC